MEPDLQIRIKGLDDQIANKVGCMVSDIIKGLSEIDRLDFRRMHKVIVAVDFAQELNEISKLTALGNPIVFTNEDYGIAVAKVLLLPHGSDYEIVPVFNADLLIKLTEDPATEAFKLMFHLVHHELCHVHDDNKKLDILARVMLKKHYTGKDKYTGPLAECCWAEYFANFLSSCSASETSVSMMTDSLVNAIERTKSQIDAEIRSYRWHGDLDKLMSVFGRHGHFLITTAAYVLGYMDGLNKTLQELSPKAAACLTGSYFENTWQGLHPALREMRAIYPDGWKGLEVYAGIVKLLEDYYAIMGLFLSTAPDGQAYVKVPFTPETMPFENF